MVTKALKLMFKIIEHGAQNVSCLLFLFTVFFLCLVFFYARGRRGRDRMVVGFAIAHAISAYHH
jgi:hypothetical protein